MRVEMIPGCAIADRHVQPTLVCTARPRLPLAVPLGNAHNTRMRIATWNINGVKARLDGALAWLRETGPDVACFQEIKCTDETFPTEAFEGLGYNVAVHGQKGFNGVAILSKRPLDEVAVKGLPGDAADTHSSYIEAVG